MWTEDFKARLEKIISGVEGPSWIKDYKEFNDHNTVHMEIQVDEKYIGKVVEEGILERFKLQKLVPTSNLVAFDARGRIRKYEKVEDILEEYYVHRLAMYTERKVCTRPSRRKRDTVLKRRRNTGSRCTTPNTGSSRTKPASSRKSLTTTLLSARRGRMCSSRSFVTEITRPSHAGPTPKKRTRRMRSMSPVARTTRTAL
jgi:hypothetical protein